MQYLELATLNKYAHCLQRLFIALTYICGKLKFNGGLDKNYIFN